MSKLTLSADLTSWQGADFFGYTHCPSICPTTLQRISNTLATLGPTAGLLQVFFVTVDPEQDTADQLRGYLSNFDTRITGLTGQVGAIDTLANALGSHVARSATTSGHAIDHTTSIYLLDRTGYIVTELPHDASEEEQASALRRLIHNST